MGIEFEDDSTPEYGYQQQNYTMAQQNYTTHQPKYRMGQQTYTTHQPNYTMMQQNYNMEEQDGYDYHYQQQQQHYQVNNHRVVQPVAHVYTQPSSRRGWGSTGTNSQQYYGNHAFKYSDSGYQNSSGGYQSEWMY